MLGAQVWHHADGCSRKHAEQAEGAVQVAAVSVAQQQQQQSMDSHQIGNYDMAAPATHSRESHSEAEPEIVSQRL